MNLPKSLVHLKDKKIILGSGSPRRAELLRGLGFQFEIRISEVDETVPSDIHISEYATFLSELKSNALLNSLSSQEVLITADTIVTIEGRVINKPKNNNEAYTMLRELSGVQHQVITGITCSTIKGKISAADTAQVSIVEMDEDEISYYIDTYKPMDKAGAYGIQEWFGLAMIDDIIGSYYTIMGLPTHKLYNILKHKIQPLL